RRTAAFFCRGDAAEVAVAALKFRIAWRHDYGRRVQAQNDADDILASYLDHVADPQLRAVAIRAAARARVFIVE
ncbi:MAG: hypothetical protein FJ029_14620, partial [Actinobacteria bacterium]|nr:hypothetical protein [Actinomycetota bacterium]